MTSFGDVYEEQVHRVMTFGDVVEVSGKTTKELCLTSFEFDPHEPGCDRPGFSKKFALYETLMVICGRGDLSQLRQMAPRFPTMAPSYVTYGPRLSWQLSEVVKRLKKDANSRQALAMVYMPEDFHKGYPDCPCTLSLQFILRKKLHLMVTMRSNDLWYGTPIDVWMFTFLQRQIAAALEVEAGRYVHSVGSLHAYEENWERLNQVGSTPQPPVPTVQCSWNELLVLSDLYLQGDRTHPIHRSWDEYLDPVYAS